MDERWVGRIGVVVLVVASAVLVVSHIGRETPAAHQPGWPYTSVVKININGCQGSGTVIGHSDTETLILSCRHVCERVGAQGVISLGDERRACRVVGVLPGDGFPTDVALLVCPKLHGVAPVELKKFEFSEGPYTGIGHRGTELLVQTGDAIKAQDGLIITHGPYIGGMSGGALLGVDQHLVGVVVASDRVAIGVSVSDPVIDFVDDWLATGGK